MNELTRNSPLLRAKGMTKQRAQAGAEEACRFESGRSAPAACKFFVLDVSQIAKELGLPTCNEASDMTTHVWFQHAQACFIKVHPASYKVMQALYGAIAV